MTKQHFATSLSNRFRKLAALSSVRVLNPHVPDSHVVRRFGDPFVWPGFALNVDLLQWRSFLTLAGGDAPFIEKVGVRIGFNFIDPDNPLNGYKLKGTHRSLELLAKEISCIACGKECLAVLEPPMIMCPSCDGAFDPEVWLKAWLKTEHTAWNRVSNKGVGNLLTW